MTSEPVAYFITFTSYGTWLQGRDPGWIDRSHNEYGSPIPQPDASREAEHTMKLRQPKYVLDAEKRTIVLRTIRDVAAHRQWKLWAVHVRSNHVHVVISASAPPEKVLNDLKAWSSRRLRENLGESADRNRWTQHGSTLYLWSDNAVIEKVEYVVNGQGDRMEYFDHRESLIEPDS